MHISLTPEVHEKLPKSKVYPGDILYSMAGTIGLAVLAPDDLGECNSNQAIAKIRLKPDTLEPSYLVAFLNSKLGRYQSERLANGQTVLNINLGEIGKILVPVPPPEIQKIIVAEMNRKNDEAKYLRLQAEAIASEAKVRVERMILGEEVADKLLVI